MEATKHDWLPLYEALVTHGYPVAVFNPFQIKTYRQVGLRKTKTDAVDSFWIADFLRIGRTQPMVVPPPPIRQMRELARFRFTLLQRRSDIHRRALTILDRVFPEYPTLFSSPFSPTSQALPRRAVAAATFADWPKTSHKPSVRPAEGIAVWNWPANSTPWRKTPWASVLWKVLPTWKCSSSSTN